MWDGLTQYGPEQKIENTIIKEIATYFFEKRDTKLAW